MASNKFVVRLRGTEAPLELPRITMSNGVRIALYDPTSIRHARSVLRTIVPYLTDVVEKDDIEVMVVPATKPVPLAFSMAYSLGIDLVVLKKERKPYWKKCKSFTAESITSDKPNEFFITQEDYEALRDKNVIFFDDVLSTGATYRASKKFLKASCKVKSLRAVFVFKEGNAFKADSDVVYFGNLPLEKKDDKFFRKREKKETPLNA